VQPLSLLIVSSSIIDFIILPAIKIRFAGKLVEAFVCGNRMPEFGLQVITSSLTCHPSQFGASEMAEEWTRGDKWCPSLDVSIPNLYIFFLSFYPLLLLTEMTHFTSACLILMQINKFIYNKHLNCQHSCAAFGSFGGTLIGGFRAERKIYILYDLWKWETQRSKLV